MINSSKKHPLSALSFQDLDEHRSSQTSFVAPIKILIFYHHLFVMFFVSIWFRHIFFYLQWALWGLKSTSLLSKLFIETFWQSLATRCSKCNTDIVSFTKKKLIKIYTIRNTYIYYRQHTKHILYTKYVPNK